MTILIIAVIFLGIVIYGHRRSLENLIAKIEELEEKVESLEEKLRKPSFEDLV